MASDTLVGSQQEDAYEEKNVHEVYQQIAHHFSSTRYKPWPIVKQFLTDLKPGSIGLDVGCGNGKNLSVNKDVFIVASDRSVNLARIAQRHQPHSTVVADILSLPHPDSSFDFAISIAVIHHLSTPERRISAIREILRTIKPASASAPGGKALIYVWALEQKDSRRGWDKGDQQDRMVPWVMKGTASAGSEPQVFHRYYHLYQASELEQNINEAGGHVLDSGYEKDNWWVIATRPCPKSS
ncbi:tRNA (carboxymethyluridine(34)-5-O)-methyltransferase [Aspergillus homomorphus CBS 101889]|uniref:Uracil-5--methyltransferase Trm9 n=1 Tax=Aspergillus homomorphus (strain CBS 101889) TaxID=1450537 RepID=A0A395HV96_ASPHC|nr:uracil-5--methyltransferase Trm9 [Aspergillus homomorphus CBS 101889]RAL10768.1 uracil-5--methyltransferase Trm9 [Aspergillus homomorphus CBS 101889]